MITKLANDDAVNDLELLSYSRHTNTNSSLPYKRSTENSRANFQKALQTVKLPSTRTVRRQKYATTQKNHLHHLWQRRIHLQLRLHHHRQNLPVLLFVEAREFIYITTRIKVF